MVMLRPTHIPWIGEIPFEWEVIKLKYASLLKGRIGWQGLTTDEYRSEGPYLVTGTDFENGVVAWERCHHVSEERYQLDIAIQIKEDDLLITKDGTIGKVAVSKNCPDKVCLNSGVFIIRNIGRYKYHSRFMYYVLQSEELQLWFSFTDRGNSTVKHLTQEKFYNFSFAYPPLAEQQAIADYLDDRCSKIDEIIAEATASIEEYKELKQAVIFEAVTKGLDKNVPMRQSNVGWIDSVPCSWNVGKLRLLAEFYNGDRSSRYPSGDDIQSEGIIFVTSNNLGNIRLNIDIPTNKYITKEKYDELGGAKLCIDDIVFCLRGSVGKCSINKIFDAGTIASSLVVIRPKKINPDYLNYVLQTSRITDEAIVSAIGIGSANLAAHDISEFFVPVPSKAEQQEIVDYLDVRVGDMDALISEKQTLIDDLQAYKKSLIYEVVTGKRRVV